MPKSYYKVADNHRHISLRKNRTRFISTGKRDGQVFLGGIWCSRSPPGWPPVGWAGCVASTPAATGTSASPPLQTSSCQASSLQQANSIKELSTCCEDQKNDNKYRYSTIRLQEIRIRGWESASWSDCKAPGRRAPLSKWSGRKSWQILSPRPRESCRSV